MAKTKILNSSKIQIVSTCSIESNFNAIIEIPELNIKSLGIVRCVEPSLLYFHKGLNIQAEVEYLVKTIKMAVSVKEGMTIKLFSPESKKLLAEGKIR